MTIRDNLTRFSCRSVDVKDAKFDWTRTAKSPSLLLSPGAFGHY